MTPKGTTLPSSHVTRLIRTWKLRTFQKKKKILFKNNLSVTGCPTSGCALRRPRRKRASRGGGTGDKNPDRGPSRSDSLGFPLPPRAAETVQAGVPGWAALLSPSPGAANGCPRPGCSGPGPSEEGPGQAAAARSAHVISASTAEMERRPGDRGRMGGREAPRRSAPPDPRQPRHRRRLPRLPASARHGPPAASPVSPMMMYLKR